MSPRKILFLVSIWLIPVLLLTGFIAAIRYVLTASRPTVVAANDNQNNTITTSSPKATPNTSPKPTASASPSTIPVTNEKPKIVTFYEALEKSLTGRKRKIEDICDRKNDVAKRILEDYGAFFVAHETVLPPPVCMFLDSESVRKFQIEAGAAMERVGGATIELQPAAMKALLAARKEAQATGLDITPRGGAEAARRSFDDTLRLWDSRFIPALAYWAGKGKITFDEVRRLKNLPIVEQVAAVLELEKQGIFFSKDFSKSILYSVAAPGTSQHLSMLALDVSQFNNPRVRQILARYGWYRTVQSDLPHFTFLGRQEKDLPALGLKKMETRDGEFWIPNVEPNK